MEEVKHHHIEGVDTCVHTTNNRLIIEAKGEPGAGGAHLHYHIGIPWLERNSHAQPGMGANCGIDIVFQEGNPKENWINGVTNEALLAIVIHRLEGFQKGPFAARENEEARKHLAIAMGWLQSRTKERLIRDVEGKQEA